MSWLEITGILYNSKYIYEKLHIYSDMKPLRHTVMCRVAKKVACNTHVLFTHTKILLVSTSRNLKTTEQISNKFAYFMLYIYLTLYTKFDVDCTSGS